MNVNPSVRLMDGMAVHLPSDVVDLAIQFAIQVNQDSKSSATPPLVIGPHHHPGLTLPRQETIKDHCWHLLYAIPSSKQPAIHTEAEKGSTGTSLSRKGSFAMALGNDRLPKDTYTFLARQGEVESRA